MWTGTSLFRDQRCQKVLFGVTIGTVCFLFLSNMRAPNGNERYIPMDITAQRDIASRSGGMGFKFGGRSVLNFTLSKSATPTRTLPKYGSNIGGDYSVPSADWLYDVTADRLLDKKVDEMSLAPIPFLPTFKNPCWYESLPDEDLYKSNLYTKLTKGVYSKTFSTMRKVFEKREEAGFGWRIRCLPYFYIPGVSKCGTTDLYAALSKHPDVAKGPLKEPLFWNRIRLETPQYRIGWLAWAVRLIQHIPTPKPFRDYVELYDKAAEEIRTSVRPEPSPSGEVTDYHYKITGDATPSYLYDYDGWTKLEVNEGLTEPRYTVADVIHELTPQAKIIMILREPADRLFSDYKFFSPSFVKKSVEDFHERCAVAIDKMEECLAERTIRSCIYDRNLTIHSMPVRLRIGMYYPFLMDWFKLYPRENVFVTRLEDYGHNRTTVLGHMYKFLGLEPLFSDQDRMSVKNKSKLKYGLAEGMLNNTRAMINKFYRRFNYQLADFLQDDRFKWGL